MSHKIEVVINLRGGKVESLSTYHGHSTPERVRNYLDTYEHIGPEDKGLNVVFARMSLYSDHGVVDDTPEEWEWTGDKWIRAPSQYFTGD